MTTPDAPEAPEVDLVRRTLRAVAAGLEVAGAPLPDEAAAPPGPSGTGPGRRPGWRSGVALAAAAVVLATGVWAVLRSTDQAQDTAPRPPADVPETTDRFPQAGWLPATFDADGATTGWSSAEELIGAIQVVGVGADDVTVAAHLWGDASVAEATARKIAPYLGLDPTRSAPSVADLGPGIVTMALSRTTPPEAVLEQVMGDTLPPDSFVLPEGWDASSLELGWVPEVGPTATSSFGVVDDRPSLRLHAVAGTLPEPGLLTRLLVGDRQVAVGPEPAWIASYGSGAQLALLWQESPGIVAVVVGWGVAEADLVRVAEQAQWPDSIAPEPERPADATAGSPTTPVDTTSGPEDWMTLCGPRPGDPALPGEEDGEASSGVIGVTGQEDIPYDLLLWEDRVTRGGERTAPCWRLDVAGADRARGGGDVAGLDVYGVHDLVPMAWTAEETVVFMAHDPGVSLTSSDAEVMTTELDVAMPDGTRFSFVRVARDAGASVLFQVIDDGRVVGDLGPWAMDRP